MTKRFTLAYGIVVVLIAALAAILIGALVLEAIGVPAFTTYAAILSDPLQDLFGLTEIGVRAVPLILVALGIAIAFRAGILNIGAEGQMQIGIITATVCALAFPDLPKILLLPLTLISGAIGGALWASIAGVLKARLGVNEILSTVMLNYIAAQIYGFLLRGPMIDPDELLMGSGTPQSVRLPRESWLDKLIPGYRLHWGILVAIVLAVVVYLLLWRTSSGFRMRAAGAEPKAARYAGISVENNLILAMVLSGAFAGLAGAVELTGVHHRAIEGISSGYGFSGIVVALFGLLHPAGIIPSALFFSLLIIGTDMTQRSLSVPANMVLVLQGAVILSIVSAQMFLRDTYARERFFRKLSDFKQRLFPSKKTALTPAAELEADSKKETE